MIIARAIFDETAQAVLGEVFGTAPAPTGNIEITSTAKVDVSAYATAQVVDANLVAENIKKDVAILGVTGSYDAGK